MSKVYKFVELIGTSSDGYKAAIANGIQQRFGSASAASATPVFL